MVEMWKNWNFTSCWWGHRVVWPPWKRGWLSLKNLNIEWSIFPGSSPHRYTPLKAEKEHRPRRNLEKMEREGRGETKSRKKRKHFKSEETGQLLMLVLHITETHQTIKRQQC